MLDNNTRQQYKSVKQGNSTKQ